MLNRLWRSPRILPDGHVFIVGAQKAGTTSLHFQLSRHPGILEGRRKELHYFDFNFSNNLDLFYNEFSKSLEKRKPPVSESRWFLDSSPSYLFHPLVPARIQKTLPNSKLIVLLRNPADRAVSHYFHNLRQKRETRAFPRAIVEEKLSIEFELREQWDDPQSDWRHFSYLRRGFYSEQVQRLLDTFPSQQLKVRFSEDYFKNPGDIVKDILVWLGLEPSIDMDLNLIHNEGLQDSSLSSELAKTIAPYFSDETRRLEKILGRDTPWG